MWWCADDEPLGLMDASATPATEELRRLGAPATLRDGSRVRIRQIRDTDGELLLRGFEHLSPESRYRRFLGPMPKLPGAAVRYLTDVDHDDHEAMIALDEQGGEGIGVARYVRDPHRRHAAEVAVTVVDHWQGRGLGTLLLEVLSGRAREEGITTFTALMLADNEEMADLLRQLGPVRIVDHAAGTVEVEVPIRAVGLDPALRKLIRLAAHRDVAVPMRASPGGDGRA
jgi:GNAT superfamily N-acetyltransferase